MLSQQYTASWVAPGVSLSAAVAVRLGQVENETGHASSFDAAAYLAEQIRQRLAQRAVPGGAAAQPMVADVAIYLYQEGSALTRWLGPGQGAAYAVVHVAVHEPGRPVVAELLTVSVISGGGLFSAGGEKTVLEDGAAALAAFLDGKGKP